MSNNPNLSRLAAKQKRLQDWKNFSNEGEIQDETLRKLNKETLDEYHKLLAECWKAGGISDELMLKLDSVERKLEKQNEEARMRVVAKKLPAQTVI